MELKSVLLVSLIFVQNCSLLLSTGQSNSISNNVPQYHADFLRRWLGEKITETLIRSARKAYTPIKTVNFYLYTAKNPYNSQELFTGDIKSVKASNFARSSPTRILFHGWLSNPQQEVITLIRDAYLSTGPQNIIVVNWSEKSIAPYPIAVESIPDVGNKVAAFIDFMTERLCINSKTLTLVGHSLGAHIAGNAARSVKHGPVHTIVALDPASILCPYNSSETRLRSTDAYYVESIQTDCALTGYEEPIGKATFYPNGGQTQPGCELETNLGCSHCRSYKLFAEAIKINGLPSVKCSSVADALTKKCGKKLSRTVRMGAPGNADVAEGIFYVPTRSSSPYVVKPAYCKNKIS